MDAVGRHTKVLLAASTLAILYKRFCCVQTSQTGGCDASDTEDSVTTLKSVIKLRNQTHLFVASFVDHCKGAMAQHVASVVLELPDALHGWS